MHLRSALFAALVAATASAQQPLSHVLPEAETPSNVLLVVADDLGCDMLAAFSGHPAAPPTPNLDAFAARGVTFLNAYTDPVCSPSRACMLTGRYGFRTYLGDAINEYLPEYSLAQWELTVPEVLHLHRGRSVANAAIGKWHLGSVSNGGPLHPNLEGFSYFRGTLGNLFLGQGYFNYTKVTNGVATTSTKYATSEQVDDALARIGQMREPWFMYLGFNGAHKPFHVPPAALHTYALSGPPNQTPAEHFRAAVQALDTEFGRLMANIDPDVLARTTVIFIGDNGSPNEVSVAPTPPGQGKGTLFEGGVHVPLIISSPVIEHPGSSCYAVVNSVDVFPTILARFDIDAANCFPDSRALDGVDLTPYLVEPWHAPLREWVFATKFVPNGPTPSLSSGHMIRDARWKLVSRSGQGAALFDMASAQGESLDLLSALPLQDEAQIAYERLLEQLKTLLGG